MHQTIDLEDGYMGSGKLLKRAVNKYGVENFKKEILHVFETEDDMRSKEAELVNEEYVARDDTYNLCQGGKGGFGYLNENGLNNSNKDLKAISLKISKGVKRHWENRPYPTEFVELVKARHERGEVNYNTFSGRSHKDTSKAMIGAANAVHQKGSGNSQYGTCWVNNGNVVKKISKNSLDKWLTQGWKRGRKL